MSNLDIQEQARNDAPRAFVEEFREHWDRLPDKGLFLGLAIPWLLLFHFLGNATLGYGSSSSLFDWMAGIYSGRENDETHGYLIPIVVLCLFWQKRDELAAVVKRNWAPGLAVLGVAVALHVLGFVVQQGRISVFAFFLGLYGIMGLTWGLRFLRESFFPYVLFAFCMPLGALASGVTVPLRLMATKISVWLGANLLNIGVMCDGSRIFAPDGSFQYDVAPACSGIRSLTALLILTTIVSFVSFSSWWRRLALIAAAGPVAIAGNVLRITTVIVAAEAFGEEAGGLVHDHAWVLTWGLALACMWGVFTLLNRGLGEPGQAIPERGSAGDQPPSGGQVRDEGKEAAT